MMAYLTLDGLVKRFGAVTAVDDLSLEVEEGEVFALLGPSGCGKSTTLRMIAGLERPTAGTISIGGRDVTHAAPQHRNAAMVFQDYALYPHMTVLENIGYPLKVRGVSRKEIADRVTDVARSLQLDRLLDRRPGQLSGGQQQRAAVGRAVVHRADVFLFDEPLSNLDAKLRHEARAFLKRLQREIGTTTVFVTHDQSEAMALADRIGIMDEGKLIQVGKPVDVYRRPDTLFVAGFIGDPPMNLIPCTIRLEGGAAFLHAGGQELDGGSIGDVIARSFQDGEEAVLGIRPEHLHLRRAGASANLSGATYAVQPFGSHVLITFAVGGTIVSAVQYTEEPPEVGDTVHCFADPHKWYLYRVSGELIVHPEGPMKATSATGA